VQSFSRRSPANGGQLLDNRARSCERAPITEQHRFDARVRVLQIVLDRDDLTARFSQHQVVSETLEIHVRGSHAGSKLNSVCSGTVANHVDSIARAEHVGVVSGTAVQKIIPGPSVEKIITPQTGKSIVARTAVHSFGSRVASNERI